MLRQAENRVKIEGILSEIDLKYGSYERDGSTVDTVGGNIKVLVQQEINGSMTELEIPVYMFSTKLTKRGTINPAYESIEKVMKEYTSVAACGNRDTADRIRITNAQIRMNEFIGQNGQVVSQPRVQASFINKAIGTFKPEATFNLEFMVSDIHRVTDTDGTEVDPPKVEVVTVVPQYGERVDVVKLTATNPNVINAIESYWEAGYTYKANGKLNFTSTTQIVKEEVDFGEPVEKIRTINLNEFLITGGSQSPMDEDFAFAVDDIRRAMAERKDRLDNSRVQNSKKTPVKNGTKGKLDLGF